MTFLNRKARTEAKKTLAEALNTSVKHVNRMGICDKPLETVINREKTAEKASKHRENCRKHAEMVVKREISPKKAAKECGISERQMARYVSEAQSQRKSEP